MIKKYLDTQLMYFIREGAITVLLPYLHLISLSDFSYFNSAFSFEIQFDFLFYLSLLHNRTGNIIVI